MPAHTYPDPKPLQGDVPEDAINGDDDDDGSPDQLIILILPE